MDRDQEEFQFMGFFDILKESFGMILRFRKIFAQIFVSLIIPLSFLHLSHIEIAQILFTNIMHDKFMLDVAPKGTEFRSRILSMLASEWMALFLFKVVYLVFFVALALLSTSAVVYTVACVYTAKEISFWKVIRVVPKVWKRLIITFVWNFVAVFAYNLVCIAILVLGVVLFCSIKVLLMVFLVVFTAVYLVGLIYITVIWHLAGAVSVLEENTYGIEALTKSHDLTKGKIGIVSGVFLVLGLSGFGVEQMFKFLVVFQDDRLVGIRIGIGILCLILLSVLMLLGVISQTIVYFVCKSYHHENIDKSSLAEHLGGYLGEYAPLKSKDLQLDQYDV